MRKIGKPSLYQVAAIGMPLLAVVSVAAMGTQLIRTSHALDQNAPVQLAAAGPLPTVASTACCRISVTSNRIITGTTRRVSAGVSLHNVTNSEIEISPGLQFSLLDTNGHSHAYTANYIDPHTVVGGPLGPGKTMDLRLDFDMAPSEVPHAVVFQLDASSQQIEVGLL